MFEFIFVLMISGDLRSTEFYQTHDSCQSKVEMLRSISIDAVCIPKTKEEIQISREEVNVKTLIPGTY